MVWSSLCLAMSPSDFSEKFLILNVFHCINKLLFFLTGISNQGGRENKEMTLELQRLTHRCTHARACHKYLAQSLKG